MAEAVRLMGTVAYGCDHPELPSGVSLEIRDENMWDFSMFLPAYLPDESNNFLLAHDLGHMALHFSGAPMRANLMAMTEADKQADVEANQFAFEFLMPEFEFKFAWEDHEGDIPLLATMFGVTQDAVETRAVSLDLLETHIQKGGESLSINGNTDTDEDPSP
ncbi:MAG: ImmA/IrrE family metallo-endopeptidase [Roseibium sp.]|uniref:ImmA/IrrE family metallo-endopeptidase n=1 Tax=Roseibium sp. TaxID=1936156 RepID=UPI00329A2B3A